MLTSAVEEAKLEQATFEHRAGIIDASAGGEPGKPILNRHWNGAHASGQVQQLRPVRQQFALEADQFQILVRVLAHTLPFARYGEGFDCSTPRPTKIATSSMA